MLAAKPGMSGQNGIRSRSSVEKRLVLENLKGGAISSSIKLPMFAHTRKSFACVDTQSLLEKETPSAFTVFREKSSHPRNGGMFLVLA